MGSVRDKIKSKSVVEGKGGKNADKELIYA